MINVYCVSEEFFLKNAFFFCFVFLWIGGDCKLGELIKYKIQGKSYIGRKAVRIDLIEYWGKLKSVTLVFINRSHSINVGLTKSCILN